jgi:ubiquinone/menaquinone biosynthesis C-methylase UbiE
MSWTACGGRPAPSRGRVVMRRPRSMLLVSMGAWLALRLWAWLRPTAFPYFTRSILDVPRPLITRRRLVEILAPASGERILEVGPGTGYYTLPVAQRLGPGGTLDILDVRRRFPDHTMERARRAGIEGIVPTLGDGASLPYADGTFDAVFLVSAVAEVPDPPRALREFRRVLKPGGPLVVCEIFVDPDFPRLAWLVNESHLASFDLAARVGSPIAYFARFEPG